MKGVAGKQCRGVQMGSVLNVIDNTGAKTISIITVPGIMAPTAVTPRPAWET